MTTPVYPPDYKFNTPELTAFRGTLIQLRIQFTHEFGRHASGHVYHAIWLGGNNAVFIFFEDGKFKECAYWLTDDEGTRIPPDFPLDPLPLEPDPIPEQGDDENEDTGTEGVDLFPPINP